jgi:hypothetical protein
MTMTDPDFYTAPVKAEKRWAQLLNGCSLPYECNEEFWHARFEGLVQNTGVPVP